MARICPLNSQWKWEAISHDANSFLVNFPSFQDLERVNGIQMGVPNFDAQFKISKWEVKDIQTKFDLPQLCVHVEGIPHTLRHFHGLWALGYLMGTTVDVDLPTLYSQNVVWILVAMMNLDTLNKHQDDKGYYVDVTVTLKLKGYDFRFRKQKADFKPDTMYSPFFWRRKDDDLDDHDMTKSKGKGPQILSHGASSSHATSMDVDGSRAVPAAAGSRTGVQHHSFYAGPVQALSRPAGAPARERPNMLGRTRLGAGPVRTLGDATGLHSGGPPMVSPAEFRPRGMAGLLLEGPGVVTGTEPLEAILPVHQAGDGPPLADRDGADLSGVLDSPVAAMPSTEIGGGSSSASPPLIPVIMEVSPLVSTLVGHGSTSPSSLTGSALKADFVSPSRRSGRFGVTVNGASVTDEDSMQRAMRRKAEINLNYSGIISPSKSKSFLSFSTPMISSKLASVGVNIGSNDKEISFSSNALRWMEVD
jgi:hypothetical protein